MTSSRRNRPGGRPTGAARPATSRPQRETQQPELASRIAEALAPVIEESGLYLEELTVGRGGNRTVVRVTLDLPSGPGGVDSDRLADVSRTISATLDDVDLVQGAYTLEVSTPGAERELSEPRHFSRAEGRLVDFTLADGESFRGRLTAYNGDSVVVLVGEDERTVNLAAVSSARVRVDMRGAASAGEEG